MKHFSVIILLLFSITMSAQEIKYFELNMYSDNSGKTYSMGMIGDSILFVPICTISEYDAFYLTLNRKEAKKFLKFLQNTERSMESKQNAKLLNKKIGLVYYHGGFIADFKFTFSLRKNAYTSGYMLSNAIVSPYWYFSINEQGNVSLTLDCINYSIGKDNHNLLENGKYLNQIGTIGKNKKVLCVKSTYLDKEYIHWLIGVVQGILDKSPIITA